MTATDRDAWLFGDKSIFAIDFQLALSSPRTGVLATGRLRIWVGGVAYGAGNWVSGPGELACSLRRAVDLDRDDEIHTGLASLPAEAAIYECSWQSHSTVIDEQDERLLLPAAFARRELTAGPDCNFDWTTVIAHRFFDNVRVIAGRVTRKFDIVLDGRRSELNDEVFEGLQSRLNDIRWVIVSRARFQETIHGWLRVVESRFGPDL